MLESALDAFVAMDAGGVITGWNRQAEATFGWPGGEARGRVLTETIIPARYRERCVAGLRRFLETGESGFIGRRLELAGLHRDGHEFPIEITISVLGSGSDRAFHAFLHDISERRRRERYLLAQHAVTVALAEAETVEEAVPRVLEKVGSIMGWDFGALWTREGTLATCQECWTSPGRALEEFEAVTRDMTFEPGIGLPGRVIETGRVHFIEDVRVDASFRRAAQAERTGLSAAVGLPLRARGETFGAMEFFTREARLAEPELLEMMEMLAAQIARFLSILIEREELLGRLERLALTDELTGLPNRRAWDQGLERELARARREEQPLCVALLDLDHFKRFNDEHGHQAGDSLLREAAGAWGSLLRATDLLARYGGEEFALAFPAWPMESALDVVERLRLRTPEQLSCSAGLAAWDGEESAAQLLGRADRALYRAKDQGRDRTVIA